MYGIKEGYTHRTEPSYFHDTQPDGKCWQPDVLSIAIHLARLRGLKRLVDVGCGRGTKLIPYAREFGITGIDYGENVDYCRRVYAFGEWVSCDLEHETPMLEGEQLKQSMIICSDVVEHLCNPELLLLSLKMMLCCAPFCVLSTPDRLRTYGHDHGGPPGNVHHTREWTLTELVAWLATYGLHTVWRGWTLNNNIDRVKSTCLLVLDRGNIAYNDLQIEQLFEVESA